jgi:hypothetical protein
MGCYSVVGYRICEFISFSILISVDILYSEALDFFSFLLTKARYFSRVDSLTMHSFSIYPATTLESMRRMHL